MSNKSISNSSLLRPDNIEFTIPDFNYFCDLLHERLHAILYHYEEWDTRFSLITNLYDRDDARVTRRKAEAPDDIEALIYAGVDRQRHILEKKPPHNHIAKLSIEGKIWNAQTQAIWQAKRNENWDTLRNQIMDRSMPEVETFRYFDSFRRNTLSFEQVKVGTLAEYFKNLDNKFQENENDIFKDYFDLEQDLYIGIPLLGMGLFQGIVWIIFEAAEQERFTDARTTRRIIKYFQTEYDNLVMDWDVAGDNIRQESIIGKVFNSLEEKNSIQQVIRLRDYYAISQYYHEERIEQGDKVVRELKAQFLKTATITILLDSYAHNISAHSLTTLSWWFRERAAYLDTNHGGRKVIEILGRDSNPLITHYKETRRAEMRDKVTRTLSRELAPLFKFLLEKGAFWSGITRQTNFTGSIRSIYDILWHDFANNPLYLGTIANTERIRKLHINISIYDREEKLAQQAFRNQKYIRRNKDGVLLDGTFATVNLADFKIDPDVPEASAFVEKGTHFEALAEELNTLKAFFPGGVVGKHAFFTLLENEIRNVKHFKKERLAAIQDHGLILNISLHTRPVDSQHASPKQVPELLKVGVWLKHQVDIDTDLLLRRITNLDEEIIQEKTFQPRLGGNYQDKLCASMLLNKTFDLVQDNKFALGKIYYPWIKAVRASHRIKNDNLVEEFEVSRRQYDKVDEVAFKSAFDSIKGEGYLKKYFHLWLGSEIQSIEDAHQLENTLENFARFRFIHVPAQSQASLPKIREQGLIRILPGERPANLEAAYMRWLPLWCKDNMAAEGVRVDFMQGESEAARLLYQDGKIEFQNAFTIHDLKFDEQYLKTINTLPHRIAITVAHGSSLTSEGSKFNIRSHGELVRRFGQGHFPENIETINNIDGYELLEALLTRIGIFDQRIYNRMADPESDKQAIQQARLKLFEQHLNLHICNEKDDHWLALQQKGFQYFHFLVIHLSFIESIKDAKGNNYTENRILEFIDEQILMGQDSATVDSNFKLIITTGRGRMAWWDKIQGAKNPNYRHFISFRPIESIIGAVEDAMQMPDDINLKINLTRLLFGS